VLRGDIWVGAVPIHSTR